jgi:hypothetical protein
MAGLFPDDEQQMSQMGLIASLLGAHKGDNIGLLFQNQANQMSQFKQRKQAQEMQAMQMAEMKRQQEQQAQMRGLAQSSFAPGQEAQGPMPDGQSPLMVGQGGGMPAYAQGMMQIDPMQGMALQHQIQQANKPDFMTVPEGATVYDKRNPHVPVMQGAPKLPTGMRMGANGPEYIPQYVSGQKDIRAAGATRVNVDTKQEGAFAQAFGKQNAEDYGKLMTNDATANGKLNKLTRLETLLKSSGNTGKLTPASMELKSVAASLGLKVDDKLPFQQAAQALSNEMALEMRNPAGGAGMPGAMSDADREYLTQIVPGLSKTPEGNALIVDAAKKMAQREKDIAKLARDYRAKTGRFDEGFYQLLSEYSAKHPLFTQAKQAAPANPVDSLVEQYRSK